MTWCTDRALSHMARVNIFLFLFSFVSHLNWKLCKVTKKKLLQLMIFTQWMIKLVGKNTVWLMRKLNLCRRGVCVCVWGENQKKSPLRIDKFSVHISPVWDNFPWGRQCLLMLPVLAVSLKIAKTLKTSLTLIYCSSRALY